MFPHGSSRIAQPTHPEAAMSSKDANTPKTDDQKAQVRKDGKDSADVELGAQELEDRIAPAKFV